MTKINIDEELDLDLDAPLEDKKQRKVTTKQTISSRQSRRRVVVGTLLFCALITAYIVYAVTVSPEHLADSTLLSTVAIGVIGLAGTVVLGYISGQVYQDANTARLLAALQARAAIGPNTKKVTKSSGADIIGESLEE